MLTTIITYRKGKCASHLLENPQTRQIFVMVENKEGLSDWPILDCHNNILWDHPEKFPQYAKKLARKALDAKHMLEFARRNAGWQFYARDVERAALDLQTAKVLAVSISTHQFMAV